MNLGSKISSKEAPAESAKSDKEFYPSLYINNVKGMDKLPDGEFSFTGKGRVVSMTNNKKAGTCSCEIEIMDLTPEGKSKSTKGLEDSLNEIEESKAVEVEDEMEDEDE